MRARHCWHDARGASGLVATRKSSPRGTASCFAAIAEAARAFGRDDYRALAVRNAEFLLREMVRDGRVMRSHTAGVTRIAGYLEDHAAVALGFLDVYGLTFDRRWLDAARTIADAVDDGSGTRALARTSIPPVTTRRCSRGRATSRTTPSLPGRRSRSTCCSAWPSSSAMTRGGERAMRVLESLSEPLARYAPAFGHMLGAADMAVHGAVEVALAGDPCRGRFPRARRRRRQRTTSRRSSSPAGPRQQQTAAVRIALLADKPPRDDQATAYVCRQYLCEEPTSDPAALPSQLERASRSPLGVGA